MTRKGDVGKYSGARDFQGLGLVWGTEKTPVPVNHLSRSSDRSSCRGLIIPVYVICATDTDLRLKNDIVLFFHGYSYESRALNNR